MDFPFRLGLLRVGRFVRSFVSALLRVVLWVVVGFSAAVDKVLLVSSGCPASNVFFFFPKVCLGTFGWEYWVCSRVWAVNFTRLIAKRLIFRLQDFLIARWVENLT